MKAHALNRSRVVSPGEEPSPGDVDSTYDFLPDPFAADLFLHWAEDGCCSTRADIAVQ